MSNDFEPLLVSIYLRLLYIGADLLKKLVPVTKANSVLPCSLKNALGRSLLNTILIVGHCDLHKFILDYVEVSKLMSTYVFVFIKIVKTTY